MTVNIDEMATQCGTALAGLSHSRRRWSI